MILAIYSRAMLVFLFIGLSPRMLVEEYLLYRSVVETRILHEQLSRRGHDERSRLPSSRPMLVLRYRLLQRGFRTRMVLDDG